MPWPVIPNIPVATLKENSDARKAARAAKIAARTAALAARPARTSSGVDADPARVAARNAKMAEIKARHEARRDPANPARKAAREERMKANARKGPLKPRVASDTAYMTRIAPPMINDMAIDVVNGDMWAVYTGTNQIVSFSLNDDWATPTVIAGGMYGLQNGTGTASRFAGPTGITKVGDYLYVTDSGNKAIRKIDTTTNAVTTFKGDLSGATMITSDTSNLYFTGDNKIYKVSLTSPYAVTLLAGSINGSSGSDDNTTGTSALFTNPRGITKLGGKLYVACGDNNIRTISLSAPYATETISNVPGAYGITNDGTNLYVTGGGGVSKIEPDGSSWASPIAFAPSDQNNYFDPSSTARDTDANLHNPRGILYADSADLPYPYIFIADQDNNAIRYLLDSFSTIYTIGTPNVHITNFEFRDCIEHEGFIYFTSRVDDLILKVDLSDLSMSVVSTDVALPKYMTFVGDDLYVSSDDGSWNNIYKVFTDGTSDFICDINDYINGITSVGTKLYIATETAILEFNTTNTSNPELDSSYVIAGDLGISDVIDATGTSARFGYIEDLTHDNSNLYITDDDVGTVRKMVLSSKVVTTIAGGGTSQNDVTDGTEAELGNLSGITRVGNNLYIVDNTYVTVRRISLTSPHAVTTVAGDVDRGNGDSSDINEGLGTAPFWDYIERITEDSSGNLYIIGQHYNYENTPLFAKLMLTGGGGAVGDPYVTTIHDQRYKLPIADMPIRFYQGMVDGTLLTVNAQLRTTDNADLFAENMRSYLAHKDSMPKKKLKELEYALYSTEKLCFFEKFYIQYGDSEITLNVWDHKFKFESYKGKIASESIDGRGLTNTYSDIYKNYESQTLRFSIGKSAAVLISVYPGTMLKNGIFIEAPELSKGNGVLVNVLNASQMTLPSLKSLDPVVKKDSRLKEREEWFLDHDGYRTRNVRCA